MSKVYVIWCPSQGGYWAESYGEFKGEVYATIYPRNHFTSPGLVEATLSFSNAHKAAKGRFIEIKEMYV